MAWGALFLTSDQSRYATGTQTVVEGGQKTCATRQSSCLSLAHAALVDQFIGLECERSLCRQLCRILKARAQQPVIRALSLLSSVP